MDQFINWCNASSSCFCVLWDVDNKTISDDKPTKRAYSMCREISSIAAHRQKVKNKHINPYTYLKNPAYLQVKEKWESSFFATVKDIDPILILFSMQIQIPCNTSYHNYHSSTSNSASKFFWGEKNSNL